jgi:hypothetical protein
VPSHRALSLCLLAIAVGAGCATPVREDVFSQGPVKVFLRSEKSWQLGPLVEKDFDHPVTISPVRMAHILSRIDARIAGKREPAIPTDMLYPIAEGVSRALTRAGSEQEVVVMAIRKKRHLGIFDSPFLTSFVAYVRGPQLFVHLARIEWEIPQRQREKPPEPKIGAERMSFRVYPSESMELVDKQGVAVSWRDEIFARPTRTKVLPTGKVVRKTILLESDVEALPEGEVQEEVEPEVTPAPLAPTGLSPEQLRALADLEEARLAGKVTEAEYVAKQQEIMEGGER